MILCGGYGKRFRPFTNRLPKVLLEIKRGYTMLDRQLLAYRGAGIDRILLLTGHLGDRIEERYGKRYEGLELDYVVEEKPLGTLNAIRLGMERAREDAMVSNGDVIADLNLKRMRRRFERSGCQASMFAIRMRSPYGTLKLRGDRITSFVEKPLLECYINGGFYCLREEVLPMLERFKTGNIENTVFPELAKQGQLAHYKEEDDLFWAAIDTVKDLEEVRKEYERRTDELWGYERSINRREREFFILANYRASIYSKREGEKLQVLKGRGELKSRGIKRKFKPGTVTKTFGSEVCEIDAAANTLIRSSRLR